MTLSASSLGPPSGPSSSPSASPQPQSSPLPPGATRQRRRSGLPSVRSHALFLDGDDEEACEEGIIVPKQISLADGSPDLVYDTGCHALQGTSSRMEDRVVSYDLTSHPHFTGCRRAVLVAVLDGHAGSGAVSYLEENLAQHLMEEVARQIGCSPVFLSPRTPQQQPASSGATEAAAETLAAAPAGADAATPAATASGVAPIPSAPAAAAAASTALPAAPISDVLVPAPAQDTSPGAAKHAGSHNGGTNGVADGHANGVANGHAYGVSTAEVAADAEGLILPGDGGGVGNGVGVMVATAVAVVPASVVLPVGTEGSTEPPRAASPETAGPSDSYRNASPSVPPQPTAEAPPPPPQAEQPVGLRGSLPRLELGSISAPVGGPPSLRGQGGASDSTSMQQQQQPKEWVGDGDGAGGPAGSGEGATELRWEQWGLAAAMAVAASYTQYGSYSEDEEGEDDDEDEDEGAPPWAPPLRHSAAVERRRCSRALYDSGGGCQPPDPPAALRNALLRCERELMDQNCHSGTTALVALMLGSSLWLANVGDCRAVVCDDGEARQLTVDHKASSGRPAAAGQGEGEEAGQGAALLERRRLLAAGAQLSEDGYLQMTAPDGTCSDLAVSRNLGCAHLKDRSTSGRGSSWALYQHAQTRPEPQPPRHSPHRHNHSHSQIYAQGHVGRLSGCGGGGLGDGEYGGGGDGRGGVHTAAAAAGRSSHDGVAGGGGGRDVGGFRGGVRHRGGGSAPGSVAYGMDGLTARRGPQPPQHHHHHQYQHQGHHNHQQQPSHHAQRSVYGGTGSQQAGWEGYIAGQGSSFRSQPWHHHHHQQQSETVYSYYRQPHHHQAPGGGRFATSSDPSILSTAGHNAPQANGHHHHHQHRQHSHHQQHSHQHPHFHHELRDGSGASITTTTTNTTTMQAPSPGPAGLDDVAQPPQPQPQLPPVVSPPPAGLPPIATGGGPPGAVVGSSTPTPTEATYAAASPGGGARPPRLSPRPPRPPSSSTGGGGGGPYGSPRPYGTHPPPSPPPRPSGASGIRPSSAASTPRTSADSYHEPTPTAVRTADGEEQGVVRQSLSGQSSGEPAAGPEPFPGAAAAACGSCPLGLPPLPPSATPHGLCSGAPVAAGACSRGLGVGYHRRSGSSGGSGSWSRDRSPSPNTASPFRPISDARLFPVVEGGSSVEAGCGGGGGTGGEEEDGFTAEGLGLGLGAVGLPGSAVSNSSSVISGGSRGGGGVYREDAEAASGGRPESQCGWRRSTLARLEVEQEEVTLTAVVGMQAATVATAAAAAAAAGPGRMQWGRGVGGPRAEGKEDGQEGGAATAGDLRADSAPGGRSGAVLRTCATFSSWTLRSAFAHSSSAELATEDVTAAAAAAAAAPLTAAAPLPTALGPESMAGGGGAAACTASMSYSGGESYPLGSESSAGPGPVAAALIPDPDLFHYQISQDSEFLICACDGLWDVMRNGEACRMVRRWLADGCSAANAAEALCQAALKLGSGDNISAIVLRFSARPLAMRPSRFTLRRVVSEAVL